MFGRLACWLGFHDWYQGISGKYCLRGHCEAYEDNWIDPYDDDKGNH